jgi:7-cyano-7-deazaguanine reductase
MVKAEGLSRKFLDISTIDPSILETFDYELPKLIRGKVPTQLVKYETKEFTAVCPFSGLPDIGTVIIEYIPQKKVLELKSLKYYFLSYRDVGIYQEHATQKIFDDLHTLLKPKKLVITTVYNTRGGIDTTCRIDSAEL